MSTPFFEIPDLPGWRLFSLFQSGFYCRYDWHVVTVVVCNWGVLQVLLEKGPFYEANKVYLVPSSVLRIDPGVEFSIVVHEPHVDSHHFMGFRPFCHDVSSVISFLHSEVPQSTTSVAPAKICVKIMYYSHEISTFCLLRTLVIKYFFTESSNCAVGA